MPSMNEIYSAHSDRYDELVACEDYQGNLGGRLASAIHTGSVVLELGVGTGRVTRLYAGRIRKAVVCDRSRHMLDRARTNLREFGGTLEFREMDIRDARGAGGKYDVILEGWALGHCALEEYERLDDFLGETLADFDSLLAPGGRILLIETYGTNVSEPEVPGDKLKRIYESLETDHGFEREILRTDYAFPTIEEAKRILGFFFGEEMASRIRDRIVPEYTGVWLRTNG